MTYEKLSEVATVTSETEYNGKDIVDFEIDANDSYSIDCSIEIKGGNVVGGAVRFGEVPERSNHGIDKRLLKTAWVNMVRDTIDADEAVLEADMSHWDTPVPHLRIITENIEEFGFDPISLDEFVAGVAELSAEVERVFRCDERHVARIDDWL